MSAREDRRDITFRPTMAAQRQAEMTTNEGGTGVSVQDLTSESHRQAAVQKRHEVNFGEMIASSYARPPEDRNAPSDCQVASQERSQSQTEGGRHGVAAHVISVANDRFKATVHQR